jgi:crotonobetainyl-CoA:carnitine CoA-transferase CaiB-like acyl-CoA transferase
MDSQSLSDVNVLEIGEFIAAPYCGKLLADLGANIVKVECPVGGDRARGRGPFPPKTTSKDSSGLFLYLNSNKQGITLDIPSPGGMKILAELLPHFDVLLISDYTGEARRYGWLDINRFRTENPHLIVTCITPYGLTGPRSAWKGHSINTTSAAGISYRIGKPERSPLTFPYDRGHYWAGMSAAAASMAALLAREHTEQGQIVDIAEAESMSTFINGISAWQFMQNGVTRHRKGRRFDSIFAWTSMDCKDGAMQLLTMQDRHWERFLEAIGSPQWARNPRYHDRMAMGYEYPEEVEGLLAPTFRERTRKEVWDLCRKNKVPFHPVRTMNEVLDCEHLNERDYFVTIDHPEGGTFRVPGPPFRMSETSWSIRNQAPRLGQHNDKVYAELLEYSAAEVASLRQSGVI